MRERGAQESGHRRATSAPPLPVRCRYPELGVSPRPLAARRPHAAHRTPRPPVPAPATPPPRPRRQPRPSPRPTSGSCQWKLELAPTGPPGRRWDVASARPRQSFTLAAFTRSSLGSEVSWDPMAVREGVLTPPPPETHTYTHSLTYSGPGQPLFPRGRSPSVASSVREAAWLSWSCQSLLSALAPVLTFWGLSAAPYPLHQYRITRITRNLKPRVGETEAALWSLGPGVYGQPPLPSV